MDQREITLIAEHNTYTDSLNSIKGGQRDTLAKECAEAQRKVSLWKFTEDYMPTFHAIKAADLDVNVPKDKAYSAGSGSTDYEVVFARYD